MSLKTENMNTTQLLTKEQAAVILQISTFSLDRIVKRGEIKASKVGKFVRFRPEEIDAYLNKELLTA